MKFVVLGSGARENIIIQKLKNNENSVFCISNYVNPQINKIVDKYFCLNKLDSTTIQNKVREIYYLGETEKLIVVPGSEKFLEMGIVDALLKEKIPSIGPLKKMAMIETSKTFCRNYLEYNHLSKYQPEYFSFYIYQKEKLEEIFKHLNYNFVVKADGLCGGKGVREYNESNWRDAFEYCRDLLEDSVGFYQPTKLLIEEKLVGQEFSLLTFADGKTVSHMPPVQDYKNLTADSTTKTGGMGTVILKNHSFPFLSASDIKECQELNRKVMFNLSRDCEYGYRGILYGGFMKTENGVKLIEYNARFGDPECLNILTLLETPLDLIFRKIACQKLHEIDIVYRKEHCVVRYLVPPGYPNFKTSSGLSPVEIQTGYPENKIILAAVEEGYEEDMRLMNSRGIALIASGKNLSAVLEEQSTLKNMVKGSLKWRDDIGKKFLCIFQNESSHQNSYADCGVNIEEGNMVVNKIKKAVQNTHTDCVVADYGGFSGIFDINKYIQNNRITNPVLVSSTDGVGTKTELVLSVLGEERGLYSLGQDIVGHSVNDIIVCGAKPLYFLDYVASSVITSDNVKYLLEGMSHACVKNDVAILGGETAEMPGVYNTGSYDIVGTITGIADSQKMIRGKENIREGDVVVAFLSSGPHTNGYSLIRKILLNYITEKGLHFGPELRIQGISIKSFIAPHQSYYPEVNGMLEDGIDIHGLCHITGGGYPENIPRILPDGLGMELEFSIQEPFATLQKLGAIPTEEMYRVFNCGYGMLVVVSPEEKDRVIQKYFGHEIGKIVKLESGSSPVKIL